MFSYELLSSFCAAYEEESYSLAAKKIGKDRTTIREQVKALEDTYEVDLFFIEGKRVKPTKNAIHLYAHARHLVNSSDKLHSAFRYVEGGEPLTLTIYHDSGLSNVLALKIEQELSRTYPQLKTTWSHTDRDDAFLALQDKMNGIAFMPHLNASHLPPKAISYSHIGYGKLGVYVGRKSKLRHIQNLSFGDLSLEKQYASADLINFSPDLFIVSSQIHVVSNNDMLFEMVKYAGWIVTHRELAEPYVQRGELYEIEIAELSNSAKLGLSMFYSMDLEDSPVADLVKSIAKTHYQDSLS
ncbi:LysR family transcriptional regulator [Vibrio hannami]|uniref:LysR family transcriptional regulator n=1 Tax=Vibrio hannami TaxID=2717094 RepID=UPI00240FD86D|nr:LysR family transcriptional regulator [Vibrio hannami]MDG3086148.1 LysR family transcriptional regulator [Vibrio hannami]